MTRARDGAFEDEGPMPASFSPLRLLVYCIVSLPAATQALPIDKLITVQPIAVCDDAGSNCADAAGIVDFSYAATNAIYSQAGIAITFLEPRNLNKSEYLETAIQLTNAATDEGRRLLRTPGNAQSPNPTTLNMYVVPKLVEASNNTEVGGWAFVNGNGLIINGGKDVANRPVIKLDTIAHEIGHNLGFDHTNLGAGGPENLMTDGVHRFRLPSLSDIAPRGLQLDQLTSTQISKAREPLFSINQFSIQTAFDAARVSQNGDTFGISGVKSLRPRVIPPPSDERLASIRLRFLPNTKVDGSLSIATARQFGPVQFFPLASPIISATSWEILQINSFPLSQEDTPFSIGPCFTQFVGDCAWPGAKRAVLADGSIELYWDLTSDIFSRTVTETLMRHIDGHYIASDHPSYQGVQTTVVETTPPQIRPAPVFRASDSFEITLWDPSEPSLDPSRPFSVLYEFSNGFVSQGFFDALGRSSIEEISTIRSFNRAPDYGFTSELRPDTDPLAVVSALVSGLDPPDAVHIPISSTLFLVMPGLLLVLAGRCARH